MTARPWSALPVRGRVGGEPAAPAGHDARALLVFLADKGPRKSSEAVTCVVAWLTDHGRAAPDGAVNSGVVREAYPRRERPPGLPRVASTADALRSAADAGLLAHVGRDARGERGARYRLAPAGRALVDALPDRRGARAARDGAAPDDDGRGPDPRRT